MIATLYDTFGRSMTDSEAVPGGERSGRGGCRRTANACRRGGGAGARREPSTWRPFNPGEVVLDLSLDVAGELVLIPSAGALAARVEARVLGCARCLPALSCGPGVRGGAGARGNKVLDLALGCYLAPVAFDPTEGRTMTTSNATVPVPAGQDAEPSPPAKREGGLPTVSGAGPGEWNDSLLAGIVQVCAGSDLGDKGAVAKARRRNRRH